MVLKIAPDDSKKEESQDKPAEQTTQAAQPAAPSDEQKPAGGGLGIAKPDAPAAPAAAPAAPDSPAEDKPHLSPQQIAAQVAAKQAALEAEKLKAAQASPFADDKTIAAAQAAQEAADKAAAHAAELDEDAEHEEGKKLPMPWLGNFLGNYRPDGTFVEEPESGFKKSLQSLVTKLIAFSASHPKLFKFTFLVAPPLVILLYVLGSFFYSSFLYGLSKSAYDNGNCESAVDFLAQHQNFYDPSLDVYVLKARSYICLNQFNDAQAELDVAEENVDVAENLDFWFYRGLLHLSDRDLFESNKAIRSLKAIEAESISGYYLEAFSKMFDGDTSAATGVLNIISEGDDASDAETEQVNVARQVLLPLQSFNLSSVEPLPFDSLRKQPDITEVLGFDFLMLGYHNLYYIPTEEESVVAEVLSPKDNAALIKAFILLDAEKFSEALALLNAEFSNRESLIYLYSAGFAEASLQNYAGAENFYKQLLDIGSNVVDIPLLYANAAWSASDGSVPGPEVMGVLKIAADQNNISAINNLAFFSIYDNNYETASNLLRTALGSSPSFFYSLVNIVLLDLGLGTFGKETTDRLYTLISNIDPTTNQSDITFLQLALVQSLIGEQQYNRALEVVDFLKETNPENTDLDITRAEIYEALEQPILLLESLRNAHETFPDNLKIAGELLLALAHFASRDEFDDFYNTLASDLGEETLNTEPRIIAARALLTGSTSQSRRLFGAMLETVKDDEDAIRVIDVWARYEIEGGNLEKAVEVIEIGKELISGKADELDLLELRVRSGLISTNDTAGLVGIDSKLEDTFKHIIRKGGTEIKVDAAWAYYNIGKPKEAIALVENIPAKVALEVLYQAYEDNGESEKSAATKAQYDAILESEARSKGTEVQQEDDSSDGSLFASAGASESEATKVLKKIDAAVSSGNFEDAIALYSQLLSGTIEGLELRSPAISHQNRGVLYLQLGQFDRAANDFEQALAYGNIPEREHVALLFNYAITSSRLKDYNKAIGLLQELLKLDPENSAALRSLGQNFLVIKKPGDAVAPLQKAVEISPNSIAGYLNLGIAYRLLKQNDEAIDILQRGLLVDSKNVRLHREIGSLYVSIGKAEKAKEHLEIVKALTSQ